MKKKADMGIGTLIIFIATILVAATVASVFYQTASSLQSRALSTAEASKNSISTRLNLVSVSAETENNRIMHFFTDARLIPGSNAINFETSMLTLSLSNISINLVYSNNSCNNVSSSTDNGFFTDKNNLNGTFTVEYIMKSDSHQQGYLQRGEFVKLCFSSPHPISREQQIEIRFIPSNGHSSTIRFISPSIITNTIIPLYP